MSEWMLLTTLVVTGLVLIAVDFYLPGFVLGSIGVVLLIVSLVVCWQNHGLTATVGLGVFEFAIAVGAGYASIKYFPHTAAGKKMILSDAQRGGHTALHSRDEMLGLEGVAHTVLRPTGVGMIAGKRLDVAAESGMIEAGTPIRVVDIRNNQILVRKL